MGGNIRGNIFTLTNKKVEKKIDGKNQNNIMFYQLVFQYLWDVT
jgi:hypothetical protein